MTLKQKPSFIWMDGDFVPTAEANVSCLTHTLHYGMGVFEGVRAYQTEQGPKIFRLTAHTDRLFNSAHMIDMTIPFDKQTLNQVQKDLLEKNNLQAAYLRPMVYYGSEHMGLQTAGLSTHVMIAAFEWANYFGSEEVGLKVQTSAFRRTSNNSLCPKAKANGNYVNSILALQEAKRSGCDEALMLDSEGRVAEGSSANVFIVRDGKLYSAESPCILDGITRASVIEIAQDLGIEFAFKQLSRDEVYQSDEMFFTGTAAEIAPVASVDGRSIGEGCPGPVTKKLRDAFHTIVSGKEDKYLNWLE